jgi:hypothetical protein
MKALSIAAAGALLLGATAAAEAYTLAPYVVSVDKSGKNVVATGSGEFDIDGLGFVANTDECACLFSKAPFGAYFFLGTQGAPNEYFASFPAPAQYFGTTSFPNATSWSGDPAGLGIGAAGVEWLLLVSSYQSGDLLNSSATYKHTTIADLGLAVGSYVWTWGPAADQSFTLNIGLPPTPLPAALPLFATGLGTIGLFGWRRMKKAARAA